MMTDPIADMLTRIRNASLVHKKEVELSFSKIKLAIANILVEAGYLTKVEEHKDGNKSYLILTLKYIGREGAVHNLKRISKPGHRVYAKANELDKVLNGFGMAILSTPQGLLTDTQAKVKKVGGEVICEVY
ncbi:MAG: 30S ribosomal protein S8 [Candidatus Magasanikbacteria bacterium]